MISQYGITWFHQNCRFFFLLISNNCLSIGQTHPPLHGMYFIHTLLSIRSTINMIGVRQFSMGTEKIHNKSYINKTVKGDVYSVSKLKSVRRNKSFVPEENVFTHIFIYYWCASRAVISLPYARTHNMKNRRKYIKILLHRKFNLQPNWTIFLLNAIYNESSPYSKNHPSISYISHLAASKWGM